MATINNEQKKIVLNMHRDVDVEVPKIFKIDQKVHFSKHLF